MTQEHNPSKPLLDKIQSQEYFDHFYCFFLTSSLISLLEAFFDFHVALMPPPIIIDYRDFLAVLGDRYAYHKTSSEGTQQNHLLAFWLVTHLL